MGLSPEESNRVRDDILANNRHDMPGLVRISFGMYNTAAEVDVIVQALTRHRAGQVCRAVRAGCQIGRVSRRELAAGSGAVLQTLGRALQRALICVPNENSCRRFTSDDPDSSEAHGKGNDVFPA